MLQRAKAVHLLCFPCTETPPLAYLTPVRNYRNFPERADPDRSERVQQNARDSPKKGRVSPASRVENTAMASGGYQTPSLEEPTGFGSDSVSDDRRGSTMGGGVASAPLFGIDYKRRV